MKTRLIEFLDYLGIGQNKFEGIVGLSIGFVNKVGDSIRESSLAKITAIYPELNVNWLKTGEGEMLKPQNVQKIGTNNGVAAQVSGGTNTFNHNGAKDQVIEKQEQQVLHMFEAFMVELRGFHEYTQRQDEHLDNIVKKSYLRNERNMERVDRLMDQQNRLIEMVIDQNRKTQGRADRLLALLEKKI